MGAGGKGHGVGGPGHVAQLEGGVEVGDLLRGSALLGPWGLWGKVLSLWWCPNETDRVVRIELGRCPRGFQLCWQSLRRGPGGSSVAPGFLSGVPRVKW